jgi:hypothetical protein
LEDGAGADNHKTSRPMTWVLNAIPVDTPQMTANGALLPLD